MYKEFKNTTHDSEQAAREHAAEISKANKSPWYIILTGGTYFIADTKSVQHYETLVACYQFGYSQQIQQRRY